MADPLYNEFVSPLCVSFMADPAAPLCTADMHGRGFRLRRAFLHVSFTDVPPNVSDIMLTASLPDGNYILLWRGVLPYGGDVPGLFPIPSVFKNLNLGCLVLPAGSFIDLSVSGTAVNCSAMAWVFFDYV